MVKTIAITGGTGELGTAVLPRLQREGRCIVVHREAFDAVDGEIDAIVHLAGAFSADDWPRMLDANLLFAVKTMNALVPRMRDGGRIVAISSIASLTKPAGFPAYVASKSALNTYLEVLAKELAPRRITVNALAPDTLDTPAMRAAMPDARRVPLDRIAETIAFLLSDGAASITGQVIALK